MITSPLFYNLLTVSYCLLENMFTSKNAKFGFIWNNSDDKFTLHCSCTMNMFSDTKKIKDVVLFSSHRLKQN